MPRNLNLMLRRLSTGTFKLEIVDTDIQKLQMALDKASDKLMIGMVVASLVVGSSLVLQASPLTLPKEIAWIAILGYTAAVLCGFLCDLPCHLPEVPDGTVETAFFYSPMQEILIISHAFIFSPRVYRGICRACGRQSNRRNIRDVRETVIEPAGRTPVQGNEPDGWVCRDKPAISFGSGLRIRLSALPSLEQPRTTSQSATPSRVRRWQRSW